MYLSLPMPSPADWLGGEALKLAGLSGVDPVRGGIASVGDAAAYAQVWEWGNVRQTQKGPKTTMGINPDGQRVWLSIQAPFGYVRINEPQLLTIAEDELSRADLGNMSQEEIRAALVLASNHMALRFTDVVKETVPVDTGALRESITPLDPDDPALTAEEEA